MPAPRARPARPLRRRRCPAGSDAGLADRTGASRPPMHRPDFRQSDGRPIFRPRGRRRSAGDAGNPLRFKKVRVVARGGIEPPTRGFSVRRRARLGASKSKTLKGFLAGRPNCPARPTPCRTEACRAGPVGPYFHAGQRLTRVTTELVPNRQHLLRASGAPRDGCEPELADGIVSTHCLNGCFIESPSLMLNAARPVAAE